MARNGARGRPDVPGGLPAAGWLRGGDARDVCAPGPTRALGPKPLDDTGNLDPFRHP
jgi:hypothetical protein